MKNIDIAAALQNERRARLDAVSDFYDGKQTTIRAVKPNDFFQLSPDGPVWIRGDFDRAVKKFWCSKVEDINAGRFMKGDKIVYDGFTY